MNDSAGIDLIPSVDGPSWTTRAKGAERIAALYCRGVLDEATRAQAEDSFRVLRYDGEVVVRRLLAECLKRARRLPRDIAISLATDRAEVAVPFLTHSPALADHDLLAILRDNPGPHRLAIAARRRLSGQLSDALCLCGEAEAMAVLANEGASITAATLTALLERQPQSAALREAICRRKLIPIDIAERLCGGLRAPARPPGHEPHDRAAG